MSMALPSDVPSATSDRRSFLTMIENTTKPVVFTAWDETGLADIIAMAEVVAGGAEQLSLQAVPARLPRAVVAAAALEDGARAR